MAPLPSSVAERLARLAPDQRDAATAPPGPVLCVAPAGRDNVDNSTRRVYALSGGARREQIEASDEDRRRDLREA
jgi:hypothetical protein